MHHYHADIRQQFNREVAALGNTLMALECLREVRRYDAQIAMDLVCRRLEEAVNGQE